MHAASSCSRTRRAGVSDFLKPRAMSRCPNASIDTGRPLPYLDSPWSGRPTKPRTGLVPSTRPLLASRATARSSRRVQWARGLPVQRCEGDEECVHGHPLKVHGGEPAALPARGGRDPRAAAPQGRAGTAANQRRAVRAGPLHRGYYDQPDVLARVKAERVRKDHLMPTSNLC